MSIHIYTYPTKTMNKDDVIMIETLTNIVLEYKETPQQSLINVLKNKGFDYKNIDMTIKDVTRHELVKSYGEKEQYIEIFEYHDQSYQEIKIKLVEDPKNKKIN